MILGNNFHFFHFFFLNKVSVEKMFHVILDKKQAFADYKKIDFTSILHSHQTGFFLRG